MNIKPLTPATAQNSVTSVNAGGHKQSPEQNKDGGNKKRKFRVISNEEAEQKEKTSESTEVNQQLISSESVIQLLDKKPMLPNQKLDVNKKPLPQNIKGLNRVL